MEWSGVEWSGVIWHCAAYPAHIRRICGAYAAHYAVSIHIHKIK